MPLYRVRTFKHCNAFGGEAWENVYTVNPATLAQARTLAGVIMGYEQAVSYDTISFDGWDIHLAAGGPTQDKALGYFGQGALASAGLGGILPLFNTVRVVFANATGRPEVKYLRLGANADNIGSGDWDGEFVDAVDAGYTQPLAGELEYVGPHGEAHVSGLTLPKVQDRQLGWHRRSRPGQKRGWVPA